MSGVRRHSQPFKEAIRVIDARDLRFLTCPKCSHCGTEIENWWEAVDLDDGMKTEVTCDECGKSYFCQTVIEYRFNTAEDEDEL